MAQPPLILGIDQSTQGTKALLLDEHGQLIAKASRPHAQIINDLGYVEHDLAEIYRNVCAVVADVVAQDPSYAARICAVGLSVQRETVAAWDKTTGTPLYHAIVWQCGRGAPIVARPEVKARSEYIRKVTGLELSEFFSAPKATWLLENVIEVKAAQQSGTLCLGTMESYLIYRLTQGHTWAAEPSNASRTMLMDLQRLDWDDALLALFGLKRSDLAPIVPSNRNFGVTDFAGVLPQLVPIHAALGDSQGALFGHGCLQRGQTKTTYGTGSSIMMNIGSQVIACAPGVVNSVGWQLEGQAPTYVLEGNINYSAGIISYLKDDLGLITSPAETEALARAANPKDECYFVPALSGLGAPHFNSKARGTIVGMSRLTTKKELVRAALDSIAYQVSDVVALIRANVAAAGLDMRELHVDGGATGNGYLMQLQADLCQLPLVVPQDAELSGMGVALMAGIAVGVYDPAVLTAGATKCRYEPSMDDATRTAKLKGWHQAVATAIAHGARAS